MIARLRQQNEAVAIEPMAQAAAMRGRYRAG
jgi:hypothetical protein